MKVLLQAYDFLYLNSKYSCVLQAGGQDQWGNIVAGIDLVRRVNSAEVFGITSPLLLNSSGEKFGKTAGGAVWLDPKRTSIFDYYQFWRNTPDQDVGRLLKLFTSLPIEEIERLSALEAPAINRAKEILAYEATALAHGHDEAEKIYRSVVSQFGQADPEGKIPTSSRIAQIKLEARTMDDLPVYRLSATDFENGGIWIVKLLAESGLCSSNSDARRLIKGGGAYIGETRISDEKTMLPIDEFKKGAIILKAGKKNMKKIILG
ncbi:MAG: tyrosine--tRNA ligase [Candidatus Nanoarchaeia archaeon]